MRTVLLIGFCVLGLTISSYAQEKYEYAIVTYSTYNTFITISFNNENSTLIQLNKNDLEHKVDATPLLKEVSKMTEDNWEVYSSNGSANNETYSTFYFFLRRKL